MNLRNRPVRPKRQRLNLSHSILPVLTILVSDKAAAVNALLVTRQTVGLQLLSPTRHQYHSQRTLHLCSRIDFQTLSASLLGPNNSSLYLMSKFNHLNEINRKRHVLTSSGTSSGLIMKLHSSPSDEPEKNSEGDRSKMEKGQEIGRSKANKRSKSENGHRVLPKGKAADEAPLSNSVVSASEAMNNITVKRQRRRNNKLNGKYSRQRRQRPEVGVKQFDIAKNDNSSNKKIQPHSEDAPKTKGVPLTTASLNDESYIGKIRTSHGHNSLKEFNGGSQQKIQQSNSTALSHIAITNDELKKRVVQLETLVSIQVSEMQKLRREMDEMVKAIGVFANVIVLLREAGLRLDDDDKVSDIDEFSEDEGDGADNNKLRNRSRLPKVGASSPQQQTTFFEDDMEIFGVAPTTVTDAADAAGASILSAILAGKRRMLVDVRDAELTRDPALFVEFIELAILPVAAGLEGLDGDEYVRNRVKIVFPTVKDLMTYRKSMALAAPEVVALSTLGLDPVEERDNLIVVIAPSPDDIPGCTMMQKLLERTDPSYFESELRISQPVVIINHHMMPIDTGKVGKFTVVYHLRLLSVQYMTGDISPEYISENAKADQTDGEDDRPDRSDDDDSALEAAMTHAREIGVHQGVTRAMVIRAYPKYVRSRSSLRHIQKADVRQFFLLFLNIRPWHVFVDTSPDTDADFEVAATFDREPSQEDVNYSIVECLEGSEREDELVAQQMQAALDAGQLTRVSEMLGISPTSIAESVGVTGSEFSDDGDEKLPKKKNSSDAREINDWDDLYYDDWFNEDSV
ncbi:hypothetical protein ACHAW6_004125 [Cyclotella cf. meneghiniana]